MYVGEFKLLFDIKSEENITDDDCMGNRWNNMQTFTSDSSQTSKIIVTE